MHLPSNYGHLGCQTIAKDTCNAKGLSGAVSNLLSRKNSALGWFACGVSMKRPALLVALVLASGSAMAADISTRDFLAGCGDLGDYGIEPPSEICVGSLVAPKTLAPHER